MTFSADLRAAVVQLLTDYATSAGIRLQVYRGRPSSIYAPAAFVDDGLTERFDYLGPSLVQRRAQVVVTVLHGLFDSGEAVDQRDAFVDGFLPYCASRYHQAGANTLVGLVSADDQPVYTPDWLPPDKQRTYFATRLVLEGLAQT